MWLKSARCRIFVLVLIFTNLCCYDCIRSKGRRTSSSSNKNYQTQRATPRSVQHVNTQSYARPTSAYRPVQAVTVGRNYATPRRQQMTTPRYNIHTKQPIVPSHNQPNYNQPGYNQPGYNQPGYNQAGGRPGYNQPGYNQPGYNQPGYGHPGYNQPGYNQPNYNTGYRPGYNQPGSSWGGGGNTWGGSSGYKPYIYKKSDHSTRNAVFAGLGGSALGLYLGYKIGSWNSNSNNYNYNDPHRPASSYEDVPRYSVVHHYYHGDKAIPQNMTVQSNAIGKCDNSTSFCAPNTNALCMTNGTIYCITPIEKTVPCTLNSTTLTCVDSLIQVPCLNETGSICNNTQFNETKVQIPCVSNISVFGSFGDNKLSVQTVDASNTSGSTITNQGIENRFCVTVIADPVPMPDPVKMSAAKMNNEQYIQYVQSNPQLNEEVSAKSENVVKNLIHSIFY